MTNNEAGDDPFISLMCGFISIIEFIAESVGDVTEWLEVFLKGHREFTENLINALRTILGIGEKISGFFNDTYRYFSGEDLPFYDMSSDETKDLCNEIREWIYDLFS